MLSIRWACALAFALTPAFSATFGSVVNLTGGASDIVLDEHERPSGGPRLYLVRTTPYNAIDVYSIPQRRVLTSIRVDTTPLTAALSRDGKFLYVACHDGSALNTIDLDRLAVVNRVSLPAKPEGVAVGADGRVLITTIGTGPGNSQNTLLIYDPNASGTAAIQNVITTPPQPTPPQLPPVSGRIFLANRSQLMASGDGSRIIGLNNPNQNSRTVFVYEVASGTILKSRTVGSISNVLSVSPDGSKFMAGLTLFETATLTVLAQQNAANAPFPMTTNLTTQGFNAVAQQFNLQQNQGGSVFSPDGSILYTAFDIAPVQIPPARPNITQLLVNDPDNLLVRGGLQLPENLVAKLVITSDGGTIYGLSESGFMILPLTTVQQFPLANPESSVVLLANDQCGVTEEKAVSNIAVRNDGRGRLNATAQLLVNLPTGLPGLGGAGGPGGGAAGGGVIIIVPGGPFPTPTPGNRTGGTPGGLPTNIPGLNQQQNSVLQTAPLSRTRITPDGPVVSFEINPLATRSNGTLSPAHDFLIMSNEAINIPPSVRVYQNNRDAEASAGLVPVPVNISQNEGLVDIALDPTRQKLYLSNSGLNRIEVFDTRSKQFQSPIKVGQLPRAVALSPDGNFLYVANSGAEYISVVDLDQGVETDRLRMPPIPFNTGVGIVTPSVIAASQRGLQVVMSNGTLWKAVGSELVPRPASTLLGATTIPAPRTMVSTPQGEFVLLLDGQGFASLYDASVDDFVQRRQVITPPFQSYFGPVGAGPRGQYYLVNGFVLNQSLSPISNAGTVTIPGQRGAPPTTLTRPIAAVAAAGATNFVRFAQPVRLNANTNVSDPPVVELVDVNSGLATRSATALEGPVSTAVGNTRVNVNGRALAYDATANTAYVLTTSGLSVVSLDPPSPADRPAANPNGTVNLASYTPAMAPGALVSIFGRNLAAPEAADSTPLPTLMGGVCVTINNRPMPLLMTSPQQINAQIPPEVAAGRYQMVIRSIDKKIAAQAQQLNITKYAPAVFVDPSTSQAAIFHQNGRPVNKDNPAHRDERLVIYATGLGPTKGGKVTAGNPSPGDTLAVTDPVQVFFGDPRYRQAEMVVEWSGLTPGFVGLYQINIYVPGDHMRGDDLQVTLRIGNVDTPKDPPVKPTVAVD